MAALHWHVGFYTNGNGQLGTIVKTLNTSNEALAYASELACKKAEELKEKLNRACVKDPVTHKCPEVVISGQTGYYVIINPQEPLWETLVFTVECPNNH